MKHLIKQASYVFISAGMGAVLRWRITALAAGIWPNLPVGTSIVNAIGCLCIGIVAGFLETRPELPQEYRLLATTGFLGGFTTFSAFSLETVRLMQERSPYALVFTLAQVAFCLLMTYSGICLIREVLPE